MKEIILILSLALVFALLVVSAIRYGLLREPFELKGLLIDSVAATAICGLCLAGASLIIWIVF